jgi:hypothetical protein
MPELNHPHDPERRGPGPLLMVALLAAIVLLIVAFGVSRPKPPGAIDKQPSPVAAPK